MSACTKARIVAVAMALLTAWPLVHIALAQRFGLSPWKLAGWGMYSAPRPKFFGMEVYVRRAGETGFERLAAPAADVRDAANAFLERHRWLGRLARPRALADRVFAGDPRIEELNVVVFRPELDPRTGMIALQQSAYRYGRSS